MSEHLALYRKYRPKSFTEVLGQDHIVSVLEGAVKGNAITHAYLFAGSRGTGKTSVARILARELGTSEKDLYEIDAASNRGIDDIRELREAARVHPFDSRYKVYLIDEVHMLTREAFNALLKTLEEPPRHTLFMLATTELGRLPETIISRCEVHTFKKPSVPVIKEMLGRVAKKEGLVLEPAGADLVALLSEGSFRDALGTLQKIMAVSSKKKISIEEVELVTGAPKGTLINDVILAIEDEKLEKTLAALRSAASQNIDMSIFTMLLLQKLRSILLLRFAPDMKKDIEEQYTDEDMEVITKLAGKKDSKVTLPVLRAMLEAQEETKRANIPQLPLELALIALLGK